MFEICTNFGGKCISAEIKVYLVNLRGFEGGSPQKMVAKKTKLIASSCCTFRPNLGHVHALQQVRISRITFEFGIIQSNDRICITIVEQSNHQLTLKIQCKPASVSLKAVSANVYLTQQKRTSLFRFISSFVDQMSALTWFPWTIERNQSSRSIMIRSIECRQ